MAKINQISNGESGGSARSKINEAIKTVEVDGTTITGDGTVENPLVSSGGIPEAPNNGNTYGRKNEGWTEINPSGAGIPEAPTDGQSYARDGLSNTWESAYTKPEANLAFDSKGSAASVQLNLDNYETSNDAALAAINAAKQDKSPVDGIKYVLLDGNLQALAVQDDAPENGSSYALNNGAWVQVAIQTDAPQDGQTWARKNGAWVLVPSGVDSSDYVMSSYPQDGEPISSTEIPLITLNNPSFLQDGTTPIDSTNIDSLITLEQDPNGTPTSFPFDATVDYSKRVISVTPTTEFTKGEEYKLTCSALKDSEGEQSGSINISFAATYAPILQGWIDSVESAGLNLPPNTTLQNLETYIVTLENLGLFNGQGIFHVLDFGGDYNCARVDFMNNYSVADEFGTVTYQSGGLQPSTSGTGLRSQMSMSDFPEITSNDNSWIYKLSSNSLTTANTVAGSQETSSLSNFIVSARYYMGSNNNPRYELGGGNGGTDNQCWTYIKNSQDVNRLIELSNYNSTAVNVPQVIPDVRIGIGGRGRATNMSDGIALNGILQYLGYLPDMRLKWADFVAATNNYLTTL